MLGPEPASGLVCGRDWSFVSTRPQTLPASSSGLSHEQPEHQAQLEGRILTCEEAGARETFMETWRWGREWRWWDPGRAVPSSAPGCGSVRGARGRHHAAGGHLSRLGCVPSEARGPGPGAVTGPADGMRASALEAGSPRTFADPQGTWLCRAVRLFAVQSGVPSKPWQSHLSASNRSLSL